MVENSEVKRKEEEEERLLVKDEDLQAIFEALEPGELLEEIIGFYGYKEVRTQAQLELGIDIIHYRRKELSFWDINMLLTDLQQQINELLWLQARKD